MAIKVATSLLDAKKENIIQTLYDLEVAGTDYFHIDVMDGKFVENDTTELMRQYSEYIKNISNLPIDIHLMVEDVESYIKCYLPIEPDSIIFHIESCKNQEQVINNIKLIKENNCKVGLTLKPKTLVEDIYEYLPYIHKVLVMTVEPGKGGQKMIPETVEKIRLLNKFIYENSYDVDIMIDGGVNGDNVEELTDAGANIVVAGNYILKSGDYRKAITELKK